MTDLVAAASPAVEHEELTTDTAPAVEEAGAPDANAADPSPVDTEDANKPTSLLDVVKSAIEKPVAPEESSAPESEPEAKPEAEGEAEAEPQAEDDANLPFHNHPRWKAVIAERDSLRDPAERMGLIQGFMEEKGLTNEEVAEGYHVMALLKGGPDDLRKARDWFSERLGGLDALLGNVLPDDLQQRVDDGLLDEDGAAELAKARADVALRTSQEEARSTATAEDARRQDETDRTTAMVGAVEAWEARIKATDPDYSKKAQLVQDRCRSIVAREGKPPLNATEATALADRALAEINADFKAALPKPRRIAPAPAGTSTTASAEPTSLRGAIDAALGR